MIQQLRQIWHSNRVFLLSAISFAFLFFFLENLNGRFWLNDFKVYYSATQNWLSDKNVYNEAFGLSSGYYKYSPFVLLFFTPFAILPYFISSILFYWVIVFALIGSFLLLKKIWRFNSINVNPPLLFTFILSIPHLLRELHLGNVNLILLFLLLLSFLQKKDSIKGFLLALVILFKPHFIILIPLFFIHFKWKPLLYLVSGLVLGILLPSAFIGWNANIEFHSLWIETMQSHNASLIYSGGNDLNAVNTIYSQVYSIFGSILSENFIVLFSFLFVLIVTGIWVIRNRFINQYKKQFFSLEYFWLLALIPTITLTDTEHFLLSIPLMFLLIVNFKNLSTWGKSLSIVSLFLFGGNWGDIIGPLSSIMLKTGALGWGNVLLLTLTLLLSSKFVLNENHISHNGNKGQ